MANKSYYIYITSNKKNGTLYIGVTNNLVRRANEHRNKNNKSFCKKYNLHKLIYYEIYSDIEKAIIREKSLKKWHRRWKVDLIEKDNKEWQDLWDRIIK